MQNWSDVVELLSSGHDMRCCILDGLQFRQEAVTNSVQQTVAVIKTAADECVHQLGKPTPGINFIPEETGTKNVHPGAPGIPGDELYANVLRLLCGLIGSGGQAAQAAGLQS